MVDIVRRKDVRIIPEKAYGGDAYKWAAYEKVGSAISSVGKKISDYGSSAIKEEEKAFEEKLSKLEAQQKAEKKAYDTQKKAYDASDKLIATDRAGQLKNDLLRWNMEKRQSNPTYIGSREHESDMRAEYSRLAEMYGKGLGEVGTAEFTTKIQDYVNQFTENDIKWAYQQKLKQGEESAKKMAQTAEQAAGIYGANGDVQGFKDYYSTEVAPAVSEYASTAMPKGAAQAKIEMDRNSLKSLFAGMAQTEPERAKALLDSPENFKEVVPEEMVSNLNDRLYEIQEDKLKENLILVNAGMENTKKGSPQYKELDKEKKKLEKDLNKLEKREEDYSEESLEAMRKDIAKSVEPAIEKATSEKILIEKQAAEKDKLMTTAEYLNLPSFNTRFYGSLSDAMDRKPDFFKNPFAKKELKVEAEKYKDLFGKVSMIETSSYVGTKKMFDNLLGLVDTDADQDGNVDNILMKALVGLNEAKGEQISEKDFQNYQNLTIKVLLDKSEKQKIKDFMGATKEYLPTRFWEQGTLIGSKGTRLTEEYESRMRDVLSGAVEMFNKGESGQDITDYYISGMKKAYNDTVSDAFGFDMNQVEKEYEEKGSSMVEVNGFQWYYKGTDTNGNPRWEPFAEHAKGVVKGFVNKASNAIKNRFGSL
jgi:hypothetical protein